MTSQNLQHLIDTVVERLPFGLLLTDADGNILWRNTMWTHMIGEDVGELDSLTAVANQVEAGAPATYSERVRLVQAILSSDHTHAEFTLPSETGEDIVARLRQIDIQGNEGRPLARLTMLDDVTEFSGTKAHQQTAVEIASHDLRNPLSVILVNALILSRAESIADERRTKTADRIVSSVNRMNVMIEDLLDYTLANLGKGIPIRRRNADLSVVATKIVNEARAGYAGRNLVFKSQGNLRGLWDVDRLQRVFQNLLGNTLKYSDPNSAVVFGFAEVLDPSSVEIRFENPGVPIGSERILHLFNTSEFALGDGVDSLGLGLYVARRIVEAHQGNISLTSSIQEGTRFTVSLPKRLSDESSQSSRE
jgi:signal transduction histidine kinase